MLKRAVRELNVAIFAAGCASALVSRHAPRAPTYPSGGATGAQRPYGNACVVGRVCRIVAGPRAPCKIMRKMFLIRYGMFEKNQLVPAAGAASWQRCAHSPG